MRIVVGSDHAGFAHRVRLEAEIGSMGHEVFSVGAVDESPYDYPNASDELVEALLAGRADLGLLVCGTGIGVSIRANRHAGIRAAVCCSVEMARLAREHNHANVLCLGARMVDAEGAVAILRAFLEAGPSVEPRHVHRVELLDAGVDTKSKAKGC